TSAVHRPDGVRTNRKFVNRSRSRLSWRLAKGDGVAGSGCGMTEAMYGWARVAWSRSRGLAGATQQHDRPSGNATVPGSAPDGRWAPVERRTPDRRRETSAATWLGRPSPPFSFH